MSDDRLKPEDRARVAIDAMLEAAGWIVQDYQRMDLTVASRGVAVREFVTKAGPVDYLLFADEKAIGTVEAKSEGRLLSDVEPQSHRYATGFAELLETRPVPHWSEGLPVPFAYESTGVETNFTSWLDPMVRPRGVFHFHRPETLVKWVQEDSPLRRRLRELPTLPTEALPSIHGWRVKEGGPECLAA